VLNELGLVEKAESDRADEPDKDEGPVDKDEGLEMLDSDEDG